MMIRNEPEAINDANPAEIITIIVISGLDRARKALMRRVIAFDCAATERTAVAVKISLLALISSLLGHRAMWRLAALFLFSLLFSLRRVASGHFGGLV